MAKNVPQIIMGTYFVVPIEEGWNDWGAGKAPRPNKHGGWNKRGLGNDQNIIEKAKVSFHKLQSE